MLFADHLVVIRGGGDLGTGAAYRLRRAGFPVVVLELAAPLAIRRAVAVSSAIGAGRVTVEGQEAVHAGSVTEAAELARSGSIAVLVSPELPDDLDRSVVVDARLAKQNLDTRITQAPLVVGLGPGFTAGVDCHAVVETMRGHHLGRVIRDGRAAPNTGRPGVVGGESAKRVVRATRDGTVSWVIQIGDAVKPGDVIGEVAGGAIESIIAGVARGLIAEGTEVAAGTKIADIDPRGEAAACFEISDKALAVGGGVVEAVLAHLDEQP
jgi:xanthine dehydrogenase accessory factor